MTDDLVKRLRSPEVFLMTSAMISPVAYEAADYIEKLEAALREITEWDVAYYWNDAGPLASHMQSLARKALEGKDD